MLCALVVSLGHPEAKQEKEALAEKLYQAAKEKVAKQAQQQEAAAPATRQEAAALFKEAVANTSAAASPRLPGTRRFSTRCCATRASRRPCA